MSVDWTKPIEAVHEDGRVVPMELESDKPSLATGSYRTTAAPDDEETNEYWHADGSDMCIGAKAWRIRNVAEGVKMGDGVKFKVGDRVRCVSDQTGGIKIGSEYIVKSISNDGFIRFDDGEGDRRYRPFGRYALVADHTDELAQLRAFKEQAIARYPDLGEPESDFSAAKRIANELGWSGGTDCESVDDEEWKDSVSDVAYQAIAWARANLR